MRAVLVTLALLLVGCAKCKPAEIEPPQHVYRCASEFWLLNGFPAPCPPAASWCECVEDL